MPATYEPIATYTVASTDSTITFSSIPQTYTDLRFILNGVSSTNNTQWIRFNSNSTSIYGHRYVYYNGSTAPTSGSAQSQTFTPIASGVTGASATYPTISIIDIFNYTSGYNKSFMCRQSWTNDTAAELSTTTAIFQSTSAITSINLGRTAGTWNAGTIATIYGIKRA